MKELSKKQRKLLQIAVAFILVVFIAGFFYLTHKKAEVSGLKNTTVYIQNSKLQVFDDSYSLDYPNNLSLHYPYLLVTQPNNQITDIFNLEQKKKEKEVKQVLLDYSNGNELYTKGKTTFLDNKDLGVLCDFGFIKSPNEVLCLAKYDQNAINNELISINPNTQAKKYIYRSQGILSDVKVINNQIYLGEIDTYTKKSRILIDQKPIDVPVVISTIYQMNGLPYYASLKSALNQNTESYYFIQSDEVIKENGDRIYFYK